MKKILFSLALTAASVFASSGAAICQKDCGIDFGLCLISTGDFDTCLNSEATCSLDCFKGPLAKSHIKARKSEFSVCEKACGFDYGECLVQTFNIDDCTKQAINCGRSCLTGVEPTEKVEVTVQGTVKDCEKNCGIDFGSCLILTGDFKTCIRTQASCALQCLKSAQASVVVAQS